MNFTSCSFYSFLKNVLKVIKVLRNTVASFMKGKQLLQFSLQLSVTSNWKDMIQAVLTSNKEYFASFWEWMCHIGVMQMITITHHLYALQVIYNHTVNKHKDCQKIWMCTRTFWLKAQLTLKCFHCFCSSRLDSKSCKDLTAILRSNEWQQTT